MSASADLGVREALAGAALKLAAQQPWAGVTLQDLAGAAGRSVADLYPLTRADAIECVEDHFDRTLAAGALDSEQTVRDRLFDLIMKRFEAMEPHRAAILALEQGGDRDPMALAAAHARNVRTARWVLALAGLEADPMTAQARSQGLGVIVGQARAAWRIDNDGDFAKTMASLDKNLRRAEEMFGRFAGFEARSKAGGSDTSEPGAR